MALTKAKDERPIQRFLETHPELLLSRPRHGFGDVVISQFPLGPDFKADFAFPFFNSTGVFLELIEIESPSLRMFTREHEFSRPYLHALQQAEDWLEWSQRNQRALFSTLAPLFKGHEQWEKITIMCRVIAGNRSQLTTVKRQRRYGAKCKSLYPAIEVLTYDRLVHEAAFSREFARARCVTYRSQSFFEKETTRFQREWVEELRKIPGMHIPEEFGE